jgi:OmcA/MtrC family decaheme c-type cytochrome
MPYMVHKIHAGVNLENGYTIIGYRQAVHDYSHVEFPAILNDCEVCHTGGIPTGDFPLVANPNPTPVCDGKGKGITNISWGDEGKVEIRIDSPDGKVFAKSKGADSKATGKWVKDGQAFFLVDAASGDVLQELPVNNTVFGCATNPPGTFRGEAGEQHTVWMTNPTRVVCGSCHDSIDWVSGDGHPGGPQSDDSRCSTCHQATTGEEYDRSVTGAHTVEYKSVQLEGVLVQIIDIRDTDPGDRPTVTFSLSSKYGHLSPSELNRLRFSLNGPNTDFDFYVQETATNNSKAVGSNWEYRFEAKLPDDAMGSFTLGVEGRADAVINPGENDEFETEDQMQNVTEGFAVTDEMPVDRRMVVDDAKCENCHANLSLHGGNRHNATSYCQTCHMPGATDDAVRPEGLEDESIHFKYMIHKLHRGDELENGYIVYGYRGSLHDFGHVEFPGDLRNCESCHVAGTYELPLPDDVLPTVSPSTAINPIMLPITSACLSCHDGDSTASHAKANTNNLGESCTTCHGVDKSFSVDEAHAR